MNNTHSIGVLWVSFTFYPKIIIKKQSVALQALTNLGRLSSRRWQSFPTAPDGTGLTPHFTITKINWLTLFKKIISVYAENYMKQINTICRVTNCVSRWYI